MGWADEEEDGGSWFSINLISIDLSIYLVAGEEEGCRLSWLGG